MILTTSFPTSVDEKVVDLRCRSLGQKFPDVSKNHDTDGHMGSGVYTHAPIQQKQ